MEGSDDSGDEINDGEGMTEVRFVPDDKSKLQEMFQAMSTCQALHPDPEDAENVEEEQNEDQEDEFGKLDLHSALKLEKSAISKVQKSIICIYKNGKKSIFASEKSPKMAFLVVLNFFLVPKLIFCHF